MRHSHALRKPGGTGGVEDVRQIVGGLHRHKLPTKVQLSGIHTETTNVGRPGQLWIEAGLGEGQVNFSLIEQIVLPFRGQLRINRQISGT